MFSGRGPVSGSHERRRAGDRAPGSCRGPTSGRRSSGSAASWRSSREKLAQLIRALQRRPVGLEQNAQVEIPADQQDSCRAGREHRLLDRPENSSARPRSAPRGRRAPCASRCRRGAESGRLRTRRGLDRRRSWAWELLPRRDGRTETETVRARARFRGRWRRWALRRLNVCAGVRLHAARRPPCSVASPRA